MIVCEPLGFLIGIFSFLPTTIFRILNLLFSRIIMSGTTTFTDSAGNRHVVESERIGENTYFRFARPFPGGYTELFEKMVLMKDKDTGEIGSGMAEYLRTCRNTGTISQA